MINIMEELNVMCTDDDERDENANDEENEGTSVS